MKRRNWMDTSSEEAWDEDEDEETRYQIIRGPISRKRRMMGPPKEVWDEEERGLWSANFPPGTQAIRKKRWVGPSEDSWDESEKGPWNTNYPGELRGEMTWSGPAWGRGGKKIRTVASPARVQMRHQSYF